MKSPSGTGHAQTGTDSSSLQEFSSIQSLIPSSSGQQDSIGCDTGSGRSVVSPVLHDDLSLVRAAELHWTPIAVRVMGHSSFG
jgi:hypothetical protein